MYKACIFDLDGTLTDTLESLTFSVNETLKEVALPAITEEQCRTFVGNGAKVLIEQSLKAAGDTKLLLFENVPGITTKTVEKKSNALIVSSFGGSALP